MEITLEKIELVKDRTGVSYKEAKEALEAAGGSVVDAIINIEEDIDVKNTSKIGEQGAHVIDTIKEAIRKGNVSKVTIKKDEDVLLNLPVNVGIIGTVLFPWAAVFGVLAAFGTKCRIEMTKDTGEVVDVSEMAAETFETVKEKSAVLADEVMVKGADVFNNVKEKASDAIKKSKEQDGEFDGDCCCGDEDECDGTDAYEDGCGCGCEYDSEDSARPEETCGCEKK